MLLGIRDAAKTSHQEEPKFEERAWAGRIMVIRDTACYGFNRWWRGSHIPQREVDDFGGSFEGTLVVSSVAQVICDRIKYSPFSCPGWR